MQPLFLVPITLLFLIVNENYSFSAKNTKALNLILIFVLALFAAFRLSSMADYEAYALFYYGDEIGNRFEPSAKVFRAISPNLYIFFFVYAFTSIGIKLFAIKEISDYRLLSIITYLSTSFALHDMIQIRASCAIAVFWFAIKYLQEKKIFKYILLIVIACEFHLSAAIFFILPFFTSQKIHKWFWIVLIGISYAMAIVHFDLVNIITRLLPNDGYIFVTILAHQDSDINIYNINQLLRIFIFIYLCLFSSRLGKKCIPLLKIFCLSIIALPLLSSLPVLGYRVSEMLGTVIVFLLPELIKCFRYKQNGYFFFLVCCFLFCYLNNIHNKYGIV